MSEEEDDGDDKEQQAEDQHSDQRVCVHKVTGLLSSSSCFLYGFVLTGGPVGDSGGCCGNVLPWWRCERSDRRRGC